MRDIYLAVNPTKDGKLFKIHQDTAPRGPVGGNIQALLLPVFDAAQSAMEGNLAASSLQDLIDRMPGGGGVGGRYSNDRKPSS
jgi:hypothetical protein